MTRMWFTTSTGRGSNCSIPSCCMRALVRLEKGEEIRSVEGTDTLTERLLEKARA